MPVNSLFFPDPTSAARRVCEIEWVDETQGGSSGSSTRSAVSDKELYWFSLGIIWAENLLVLVLTSEVQCLGWEVSDNVSQVTSPEGSETLFGCDSAEAVTNALVSLISRNVLNVILDLKK